MAPQTVYFSNLVSLEKLGTSRLAGRSDVAQTTLEGGEVKRDEDIIRITL
ncbi:MAG: hypothetical protein RL701_5289 [Pseudomonadota bacterium]|jgi:hypothetical protein